MPYKVTQMAIGDTETKVSLLKFTIGPEGVQRDIDLLYISVKTFHLFCVIFYKKGHHISRA